MASFHKHTYETNDIKSYANMTTLERAVEKAFKEFDVHLRYLVYTRQDGRLVPVFIGTEAINVGVHFTFPVVG